MRKAVKIYVNSAVEPVFEIKNLGVQNRVLQSLGALQRTVPIDIVRFCLLNMARENLWRKVRFKSCYKGSENKFESLG